MVKHIINVETGELVKDLRFVRIGNGYISERILTDFFEKIKDEKYFHPFCITAQFAKAVVGGDNKDEFWLLFLNQEVIGYAFIQGWHGGWPNKVLGIIIDSNYRGMGFGELFCRVLEMIAKQRGEQKLRLHVNSDNLAFNLYKKLGYTFSGEKTDKGDLVGYKNL